MLQTGLVFQDRYRIQCEVGRGSFGIVYAAEDLRVGGLVAIKILLPWTRSNPSLRHRLKREAKLTRLLKSQHAVRILDLDEVPGGDLFIVMEFLSGEELTHLVRREHRIAPARAIDITLQTLHALGEAHSLGVIHRDLKPQNIFMCRNADGSDFVKVLDFGIAKVAGTEDGTGLAETARLTTPGGVLGTPPYMSPEQCRGEALTPASDFYSLGIVLYEMATGQVPFDDPNPVQVLMLHNSAPLPPLPAEIAQTSLGRAIVRSLQKDPTARFRTAGEFMVALDPRHALPADGPLNVGRTSPAPIQRAAPAVAMRPSPAAPAAHHEESPARPERTRNRSKLFAIRGYLIGIAILILLVLLVLTRYL
jgi:serine/threonine protein kinase